MNNHTLVIEKPKQSLSFVWMDLFIRGFFSTLSFFKNLFSAIYTSEWQLKIILLCAVSVMLFIQQVEPFYVPGGDPFDYISTARYLLGQAGGVFSPWRTPGMAVFHILSGTVIFESWNGFIILYALMSILMPILVYYTLSPYTKMMALIAALISILSMVPFAYSRTALSDHLFFFMNFLSVSLMARFFYQPSIRILYSIPCTIAFLNLVRPVAAFYYWIFFVFALFFVLRHRRDLLKNLVVATSLYLLLMSGWALLDRSVGATAFETVYPAQTQAERRFLEIYVNTTKKALHFVEGGYLMPTFKAENGPVSQKFYDIICNSLWTNLEWTNKKDEQYPYELFGKFIATPNKLMQEIMTKPNFIYFNFLRTSLKTKLGPQYNTFMKKLVAENGNSGLLGIFNYFLKNPGKILFGASPPMSGRNFLGIYYFAPQRDPVFMNRTFNLYLPIPHFLSVVKGPYTEELKKSIQFFVTTFPHYWENTNEWLGRFKGNPEGLIQEIIKPNSLYDMGMWEGFYWEALLKYYGINNADRLFRNVAFEMMKQYPATVYFFWENILKLTLGFPDCVLGTNDFPSLFLEGSGDLIYNVRHNYLAGLSPGLRSGLKETITAKKGDAVRIIPRVYSFMHGISPIFVILTGILLPFFFLNRALRYFSYLLLGLYLYNVLVIAVFGNFSCPRYKDVFILFPVMLTCLGVYALFQRARIKGIPLE